MGIYPTIYHFIAISILITYTVCELQLETTVVGFKKYTAVIKQKMVSKGVMFTVDDFITQKLLDLGDPVFAITSHPVYQYGS
jgi:hypothetical protein